MHFSGNKSILGDSLLSYFPVPQFSRSDMRCNNYWLALSVIHNIYHPRSQKGETWWPRCSGVPHFRLAILGKCVSSLIVPPTRANDAFTQVFNFNVVLQTSYVVLDVIVICEWSEWIDARVRRRVIFKRLAFRCIFNKTTRTFGDSAYVSLMTHIFDNEYYFLMVL